MAGPAGWLIETQRLEPINNNKNAHLTLQVHKYTLSIIGRQLLYDDRIGIHRQHLGQDKTRTHTKTHRTTKRTHTRTRVTQQHTYKTHKTKRTHTRTHFDTKTQDTTRHHTTPYHTLSRPWWSLSSWSRARRMSYVSSDSRFHGSSDTVSRYPRITFEKKEGPTDSAQPCVCVCVKG